MVGTSSSHKPSKHHHHHRDATHADAGPSTSSHKKDKRKKDKEHGEGKSKRKARKTAPGDGAVHSGFRFVSTDVRLSIPPVFGTDLLRGAEEMLDSLVMRYSPALSAVLLAHSNLKLLDDTAAVLGDCPFAVADVGFDAVVWQPVEGQRLTGTHSLSSPSHLSLLVHKTFNVSIPLAHIPLDVYHFDASVRRRPQAGSGREASVDSDESFLSDSSGEEEEDPVVEEEDEEEVGRWIESSTGKVLGEDDAGVIFTVVGLQISNQMLSLTGSLLPDPSRPRTDQQPSNPPASPIAPDSQIAREGLPTDVDVAEADGMVVDHDAVVEEGADAGKKKRKEKRKSQVGVDPVGDAAAGPADEAVHSAPTPATSGPSTDEGEAHRLKHAKKEAKRLAKLATAEGGQSAASVPNGAGEVEAQQRTEGEGGADVAKKEKKRKAEGRDGESKKKRKKDVAAL